MLTEGIVDISPQEEKAIDGMLKELERFHKKRSSLHKDASNNAICAALKQYTNEVLAPKYGLDTILWRFIFEPSSPNKAWYAITHNELGINLAYHIDNLDGNLRTHEIHWDKVAESIYHEWVHVKQDIRIKKDVPDGMYAFKKMYRNTAYYDIKWEQMALARQELEWIKRNVKRVSPKSILSWLKKMGLTSDSEIKNLKGTNPEVYKRMLKYAVMFVLKKQAEAATKQK